MDSLFDMQRDVEAYDDLPILGLIQRQHIRDRMMIEAAAAKSGIYALPAEIAQDPQLPAIEDGIKSPSLPPLCLRWLVVVTVSAIGGLLGALIGVVSAAVYETVSQAIRRPAGPAFKGDRQALVATQEPASFALVKLDRRIPPAFELHRQRSESYAERLQARMAILNERR